MHWTEALFIALGVFAGIELALAVDDAVRDIRMRRAWKRGNIFAAFRNADMKLRWQKRPTRGKVFPGRGTRSIIKFGIGVGYWPSVWKTRYSVWYGLPSYWQGDVRDDLRVREWPESTCSAGQHQPSED